MVLKENFNYYQTYINLVCKIWSRDDYCLYTLNKYIMNNFKNLTSLKKKINYLYHKNYNFYMVSLISKALTSRKHKLNEKQGFFLVKTAMYFVYFIRKKSHQSKRSYDSVFNYYLGNNKNKSLLLFNYKFKKSANIKNFVVSQLKQVEKIHLTKLKLNKMLISGFNLNLKLIFIPIHLPFILFKYFYYARQEKFGHLPKNKLYSPILRNLIFLSVISFFTYRSELLLNYLSLRVAKIKHKKGHMPLFYMIYNVFSVLKSKKYNPNFIGFRFYIHGKVAGKMKTKPIKFKFGNIKLKSLSTKIDYSEQTITTKFGLIGLKLWLVYRNEEDNDYEDENQNNDKKHKIIL
jgi:hypothetical protein